MDTVDLLARENEYKKLNQQLQKKTESLMKEIEYVMQKPDVISEYTTNLYKKKNDFNDVRSSNTPPSSSNEIKTKKTVHTFQKSAHNSNKVQFKGIEFENGTHNDCAQRVNVNCVCCPKNTQNGDMEFLYAFVAVNVKDKVLPQSFMRNAVTVESVCKCLLMKVKLMQEQIDKLQNVIDKKTSQCESHLTQMAEFESERMSVLIKNNNMKAAVSNMKAKCGTVQNKLEEKDRVYKELRSEEDRRIAELKKLKSRNTNLEARCASQEETIEKLKHQLQTSKILEKELRDSTRTMSASHDTALNRSGARQRSMEACLRTQAALIDNLRRQVALITTDGALKYLHDEYTKLLNRDF